MSKELQRYRLVNKDQGIWFGECDAVDGIFFKWLLAQRTPRNIGLELMPKAESEGFYAGFLRETFELVVVRNPPRMIKQKSGGSGGIEIAETTPLAANAMSELVQGLYSGRLPHAFLTSEFLDGSSPRILTFSSTKPPAELYGTGLSYRLGPVKIEVRE